MSKGRRSVFRLFQAIILHALSITSARAYRLRDLSEEDWSRGPAGTLSGDTASRELLACYNAKYIPRGSSFQEFTEGQPSRSLRLHRVWWSSRSSSRHPLTILTLTDLSRLSALRAQCHSYPGGPIAAAVYVPLLQPPDPDPSTPKSRHHRYRQRSLFNNNGGVSSSSQPSCSPTHPSNYLEDKDPLSQGPPAQPLPLSPANAAALENATRVLGALFEELDSTSTSSSSSNSTQQRSASCALRLLLLYEVVYDEQLAVLFPVNAVRNAALLAAGSPLAAVLDVDLSVSWSLAGQVLPGTRAAGGGDNSRVNELIRRAQHEQVIWVMPAWETNRKLNLTYGNEIADIAIEVRPESKRKLLELWREQELLQPFAWDHYKLGHARTDYKHWFKTMSPYPVQYKSGFEPWFIGARRSLPLYDARFRGYRWNKIVHVDTVAAAGFSFWVLPDVWVVHRPHVPSPSSSHKPKRGAPSPPPRRHTSGVQPLERSVYLNGTWQRAMDAFLAANDRFYTSATEQLRAGRYEPVADAASRHCRAVLSWWQ